LAKQVSATKRALAGFDQIQRLGKTITYSSAGSSSNKSSKQELLELLSDYNYQKVSVMLSTVNAAVDRCCASVRELLGLAEDTKLSLDSLTFRVDANTAAWNQNSTARRALCASQEMLTAATDRWRQSCVAVEAGNARLDGSMLALVSRLISVNATFAQLAVGANNAWNAVAVQGIPACVGLMAAIIPLESKLQGIFSQQTVSAMQTGLYRGLQALEQGLQTMNDAIKSDFIPAWAAAWKSVGDAMVSALARARVSLRQQMNNTIDDYNAMLRSIVTAHNTLARALNTLGGGGVQKVGVPVPTIPHLARGAVLPANQPFMAVVGDQHHGTNVEAPLATIQEAVAAVMQDYAAGNLAGQEAMVGVLREILEAILGIRIGDDVIAHAVERHQSRMAVVKGG